MVGSILSLPIWDFAQFFLVDGIEKLEHDWVILSKYCACLWSSLNVNYLCLYKRASTLLAEELSLSCRLVLPNNWNLFKYPQEVDMIVQLKSGYSDQL